MQADVAPQGDSPEGDSPQAAGQGRFALGQLMRSFGSFWWDFLVGDTPELFVGALLVLGACALAVHQGAPRFVVVGCLPVLTALLLVLSVIRRARPRR
jgi:hypothetical protein